MLEHVGGDDGVELIRAEIELRDVGGDQLHVLQAEAGDHRGGLPRVAVEQRDRLEPSGERGGEDAAAGTEVEAVVRLWPYAPDQPGHQLHAEPEEATQQFLVRAIDAEEVMLIWQGRDFSQQRDGWLDVAHLAWPPIARAR